MTRHTYNPFSDLPVTDWKQISYLNKALTILLSSMCRNEGASRLKPVTPTTVTPKLGDMPCEERGAQL
jgi:hypothetical protein